MPDASGFLGQGCLGQQLLPAFLLWFFFLFFFFLFLACLPNFAYLWTPTTGTNSPFQMRLLYARGVWRNFGLKHRKNRVFLSFWAQNACRNFFLLFFFFVFWVYAGARERKRMLFLFMFAEVRDEDTKIKQPFTYTYDCVSCESLWFKSHVIFCLLLVNCCCRVVTSVKPCSVSSGFEMGAVNYGEEQKSARREALLKRTQSISTIGSVLTCGEAWSTNLCWACNTSTSTHRSPIYSPRQCTSWLTSF